MVEPRFRWQFPSPVRIDGTLLAAGSRHGVTGRLLALLATRGVDDVAELDAFFAAPEEGLHDPRLLPDAEVLYRRFERARDGGERVLVFGDFDADGLTGLAILTIALRRFGVDAEPYVPSRLDEGHGLSLPAVETAVAQGRTVIVTVDCGTTSHAEIAAAAARGIDVLVTDHHHVPVILPPALALVNPHRQDSRYPDPRLAGSGVAFKVSQLLLADLPGGPAAALALCDLATIGSVSDVAPVIGENRAIARLGLERLRSAPRPGLAAILARANVAAEAIDLETISFVIAPRLNAVGRVGDAVDAARLLLADDPAEAAALAETLEAANATRRDITKQTLADARLALVDAAVALTLDDAVAAASAHAAPAVVVRGAWPVGIVGLVAARLAEETGRAAVVGAELDGVVRASCRSAGSLDLAASLDACGDLFIRHGGHRGAAGFEMVSERWPEFRERFLAIAASAGPVDPRPALTLDLALPAEEVDYALLAELQRLAPTGPGNADPLIGVLGVTVGRVRAANGGHTQLTLRRDRDVIDAIAFGRDDLATSLAEGDRIDLVARLASRRFGGYETLQLEVRDAASSGSHPDAAAILAGPTRGAIGGPLVALGAVADGGNS